MFEKILKEPFFHFLLLGVGLFAVYSVVNKGDVEVEDTAIVVSEGRIRQLITIFEKTWQRAPTEQELQGLVDDFILEEIYYRKAVAMGIDRNDTIIRRRLRQKVEFLNDDAASLVQPTDDELTDYLEQNPESFRRPPSYSFRQIYFNPEKHGSDPQAWIAQQKEALNQGDDVAGDPSLLAEEFQEADARTIDGTFGYGFSAQLDELDVGQWSGPISSGLGMHVVQLEKRVPGSLPELEQIRSQVVREWSNSLRLETRQKINEALREQYQVTIEWPEGASPSDTTAGGGESQEGSRP